MCTKKWRFIPFTKVSGKINISSLVFIQVLCDPQQFMSWFGHRGCLAGHQTTYWFALLLLVKLKLQVDFTSLAIHTKLYILRAENTVLKYGGSQGQNPKSADPFLSGARSWGYDFVLWLRVKTKWKGVCEADYCWQVLCVKKFKNWISFNSLCIGAWDWNSSFLSHKVKAKSKIVQIVFGSGLLSFLLFLAIFFHFLLCLSKLSGPACIFISLHWLSSLVHLYELGTVHRFSMD